MLQPNSGPVCIRARFHSRLGADPVVSRTAARSSPPACSLLSPQVAYLSNLHNYICPDSINRQSYISQGLLPASPDAQLQQLYQRQEQGQISAGCFDLLVRMTALDPRKRPSLQQVLNHRWTTTYAAPRLLGASGCANWVGLPEPARDLPASQALSGCCCGLTWRCRGPAWGCVNSDAGRPRTSSHSQAWLPGCAVGGVRHRGGSLRRAAAVAEGGAAAGGGRHLGGCGQRAAADPPAAAAARAGAAGAHAVRI